MIRLTRAVITAGIVSAFIAGVTTTALIAQLDPVTFGRPMPGLTPAEFERFRIGLDDFVEVETAAEGLGPAFNGTSCAGCHNVPAIGGVSLISEVRVARRLPDGTIQPLTDSAGYQLDTLFHLVSVPGHACQPVVPPEANIFARRVPIPVFGAGLVEAIPDETLIALEDPDDRDGDGVSGRAARVVDRGTGQTRIGRFGWKAQQATLRTFSADAYRNEMGITNDLFPDELAAGVSLTSIKLCDPFPDPEDVRDPRTGLAAIDNFEAFMQFLAPPPRGPITSQARTGEAIFNGIGCAACHVPVLHTGASLNPLFDNKPVPLFSDLLLHDVGTGDLIPQASALPHEIRTPSLWGLRVRRPLLHDGRAATILDAVLMHGGEAALSRERVEQLTQEERTNLLAFLASL
jgi:CxxC motif-containing protein (DUF1111 family)